MNQKILCCSILQREIEHILQRWEVELLEPFREGVEKLLKGQA